MMTEDKNSLDIEFGLNVVFQNNENTLLNNGEVTVYPIGGMMTEFTQIDPTKIKDVINRCGNLNVPLTSDRASELFCRFTEELRKEYGHATTCIIAVEFLNSLGDWPEAERQGKVEELLNRFRDNKTKEIWDFIFEDSGYDDVGIADFGQAMYTAYTVFSGIFVSFKYTVQSLLDAKTPEEREKAIDVIQLLGFSCMSMQHIDFRFITLDGEFKPLYTIRSAMSLLLFEIAHCIEQDTQFVKCKNCGKIFVPTGRKDTLYCSFQSPQNPNKTCSEIGAQVAMANKEKTDVVTQTYRRVYHRYKSALRRHPGEIKYIRALQTLTEGMKEWRENLKCGSATTEMFLDWINTF